jgi:hypothetical protein
VDATLARRVVHAKLPLVSLRSTSRPSRPHVARAAVNAALAACVIYFAPVPVAPALPAFFFSTSPT